MLFNFFWLEIVFKDLPADDPKQRKPDIGKARELLEWEPKVGLEGGIERDDRIFQGDFEKYDYLISKKRIKYDNL